MMSNFDLLQVNPVELNFIIELKKLSICPMQLSNKTDKHVAFKIKTTNPDQYGVKPNTGVILPRSTCDVIVTMQAQKDAPTDLQSKDKFMIQSLVVSPGTSVNDITRELFNKGSGNHVEEHKLRVSYVLSPMSIGDLIQFDPAELQFPFELKKQMSCSMQLSNKSDKHVGFKVKTTKPKKYCVRPNNGILLPHSTCDVLVKMQAQREAPTDLQSKDKFMIQGVVVSPETSVNDTTWEPLFHKESGNHIEEYKLRVSYVTPPMSNSDLLQFNPVELQFPFELNKQISCSLKLSNMSNNHVAFKVLPTNLKNYTVTPNCGVVVPRSTCDVAVTMQAQKHSPTDLQCKDMLKIQSVVVFNQESGNVEEEYDLRVSYVLPPQPPSLVREVPKEGLSSTASVSDILTADAAEFKRANLKVLDWRGKLISLIRKFLLFRGNNAKSGEWRKAGAQKYKRLMEESVEDVTEINESNRGEGNEETIIREQKMDGVLAPLLSSC